MIPSCTASPTIDCDPIPEYINFGNGLYAWQADTLTEHTAKVLSTVQLAVDYDPDATCPEFDRFLEQVLPADMVPLVWELIGYLMYSGNPLHKAVMLTGTGRNGKGTFLRVVVALLGHGNVTSVSLHDLVNTRFTTASLFGRIANIAGDIDGTYLESTATFKAVTGQDLISAEHKGRDRFDFTPWAVPVFSANKIPASSDTTTGYLSRWVVVPFPNDFTGREDRHLDQRLQTKAELQGIAAKALPALRTLMARGDFDLPESGVQALAEFTRKVDQVRMWAEDCTDLNPGHPFVARTHLYRCYKAWAARDGHRPVKAGEFYDRLETTPGLRARSPSQRRARLYRDQGDRQGRRRAGLVMVTPRPADTEDTDDSSPLPHAYAHAWGLEIVSSLSSPPSTPPPSPLARIIAELGGKCPGCNRWICTCEAAS